MISEQEKLEQLKRIIETQDKLIEAQYDLIESLKALEKVHRS